MGCKTHLHQQLVRRSAGLHLLRSPDTQTLIAYPPTVGRAERLTQVEADGTLRAVDECCDQLDGSIAIAAVLDAGHDVAGTVNSASHSFGFVEVVLAHDLRDQMVFERHRVGQRLLEAVAALTEKIGRILARREVGHAKARMIDVELGDS